MSQEKAFSHFSENPWSNFELWFNDAQKTDLPNPNAMVLTTVEENQPDARIVLMKQFSEKDGIVFFTNYTSAKVQQILKNNKVSLLFFWDVLERQIRITGSLQKTSYQTSKAYFHSRPRESQIGAWASKQSQHLENRDAFEKRIEKYTKKYDGEDVEYPDFWGGFALTPSQFEFWQGIPSRLHHRIVYKTDEQNTWKSQLLYP